MTSFRYKLHLKKAIVLMTLALTASSLFAYVLPTIFYPEETEKNKIEIEAPIAAHPLDGSSDSVVICPEDGSEIHEIYLCGASAERLITTNISGLKQIIWSKLQEGSCSAAQSNCANSSPSCIWDQLSTNTQYSVSGAGEYRIYVQYNDNTSERFYFNVFANGLNPNAVVANIDCGTAGSITVNNAPSSYEYRISGTSTWQDSKVFAISNVGTYDIETRRKGDTEGCIFELNDIEVTNNAIDAGTPVIAPPTCDSTKGSIQVTINDASTTYIYKVFQAGNLVNSSGPITASTYTFTGLNSGDYDIEVSLASMSTCAWNAVGTVPAFVAIQPNATVTKNIDCTDGIITLAPSGGTAPYQYSLDGTTYVPFNNGDKATVSMATAGSYNLKVKDASDCIVNTKTVTITSEPEIVATATPQDVSCNATDDGSITIAIPNTQGYSITYSKDGSTYQTSNVFSNLTAGTYNITVRKQKAGGSCDIQLNPVTVNASATFTASASVTQEISCTTGSAIITAAVTAGGVSPFEYSLDGVNFQTSSDLTGLGAGEYTITVKDANGCITTVDQTISAGSNPSELTFVTNNTNCATGAVDVTISVQNGSDPYEYKITAPASAAMTSPINTFDNLSPNTYTFEVTSNGCTIIRNFIVPEPINFTSNAIVKTNVSCFTGSSDGSIEVSVEDFNTSFSVKVEDASGTDTGLGVANATSSPITISGLTAGDYNIKISDISGPCEKVESITIAAPTAELTIDSTNINPMNCGNAGSATINATGGWGSYSYQITQPDGTLTVRQTSNTVTGLLQVGTHTITVKDINGCETSTTFELRDEGGPTAAVDVSGTSPTNYCYDNANRGVLKIDVTDGVAPFYYTVNNGTPKTITGGTFTLSNLTPDDYLVEIIGANGCKTTVLDTKISGQLFAFANVTKPLGCGTPPDAIVEITPENGYPPYTYEVDNGTGYVATTMPFSTDTVGNYNFKIIDAKGCEFYIGDPNVALGTVNGTEEPVEVTLAPEIVPSATSLPTACGKDGTGSIVLSASGGTPPFEYAFSDAPFDPVTNPAVYDTNTLFNNLNATSYYYKVRDELGCETEEIVEVVGAESAIVADIEKTDISCDPDAGGNIWGNIKVSNIQNSTSPVTISLVRINKPDDYEAGIETRTWTYRRYENIDLATNSNYLNASSPANYGTTTGYDIRMYWAYDFVVRIEDDRGCFWESEIYNITSPPIPSIINTPEALQTCENGATYDFEISNIDSDGDGTPDLVGPFDVRLYPYQLVDADGDGVEDDLTSGWRPFDDAENPLYDPADPENERNYRFTASNTYGKLLFGVSYYAVIRDNNTGCIRWRALRPIVEPPVGFITVDVTPQSETCYNARDGEIEFTVENYASGVVNYKIYAASSPANTAYHHSGTATGNGDPLTITVSGMRVTWYVVEVEDSSGCQAGERFLIYRPKTVLRLKEDQVVQPTCFTGGQVAVTASGGWDNENYFNIRNKLRQNWHPYEYALVLEGQTPADADFGPDNMWTNVVPTSYTGGNNVYRAWVRDGSGCMQPVPDVITFIEEPTPEIDAVTVPDRCTSTNEIYTVTATLVDPGANPVSGAPKYIWDGVVTSSATRKLGPGYHTLEVRDENGCTDSETIHIYPLMVAKSEITKTVDCDVSGLNNGAMLAEAYGGSGNFEFTISPVPSTYAAGEETNTTGVFTRLEPGVDYVYSVTDLDNSCGPQNSPALQLITPVDPQFEVESTSSLTCAGANDGKIILKQIDNTDNLDVTYEYSKDGTNYQASNVFENLAPGMYDINIRSAKNCVQTITGVNISDKTEVQLSVPTPSAFECSTDNGLGMATITANASGGTAPYLYSIDGGSFSTTNTYQLPYLATARTVEVKVIDANGCIPASAVTVTIPAAEKVEARIEVVSGPMNCADDEVINILGSGTDQSIYEVRELPSGNVINGLNYALPAGNPGLYSFELEDTVTGCIDKVSYTIEAFNTVEVSVSNAVDLKCKDVSEGSFEITVTGYTGAFTYNVNNASGAVRTNQPGNTSSATIVDLLPAGSYTVEVTATDHPKCTVESDQISIQSPPESLDFNSAITQKITCDPGDDAQITATPRGGWGGYAFELYDSANTLLSPDAGTINIYSNLPADSYELLLKDSGGCETVRKVITIDPIQPIVIDPNWVAQDTSCPRADDGYIEVSASRSDTYTYDIQYILTNVTSGVASVAQDSNRFDNLVEGDYTVTVTDGYGCDQTTGTIEIRDPETLEVFAEITQEIDCDTPEGIIRLSATGGSGNFEYSILSPASAVTGYSSQTDYTLVPGTYEFSVRDSSNPGCISPLTVVSTINDMEDFSTVFTDTTNTIINCFGESDAVLIAESKGGLGGYQYQLIKNGNLVGTVQDTGVFENLGAGTYSIRGTGIGGCEDDTDEFTIENPDLLVVDTPIIEEVQCYDGDNGSITINATGEAPFQYIISSQPQKAVDTNVFENLRGGTYWVTVQDVNGCSETITDIVVDTPSAPFKVEVTRTEREECSTDNNGLIELGLSGGTAPYKYNLTGFSDATTDITGNTLTLPNLDGGYYSIYLLDAHNCEQFIYQEVIVGVDLAAKVETNYECQNGAPFSTTVVTLENEELNSEVLYALDSETSNAQVSPIFENITPGTHFISIIHEGGCLERLDVVIEAPVPLALNLLDGTINEILVKASGGDGNYTYYFENQASSSGSHFINHDGIYVVRVVDGKGCETILEVPMEFIDIEIPNFFTPDNDGYKDTWVIKNSEGFPNMYVKLYDRYGRTLKEYIGQGEWDGTYNKANLPTGDYWYVIKLNGPNDDREFVGHVTIYR